MSNNQKEMNTNANTNAKEYKAIVVVLRVFDAKTDVMESEIIKTIDSRQRRLWMEKTIMWAMFNNKYVEIINNEDDKK